MPVRPILDSTRRRQKKAVSLPLSHEMLPHIAKTRLQDHVRNTDVSLTGLGPIVRRRS